jgi:MauM/NapG family ferredoxin protein
MIMDWLHKLSSMHEPLRPPGAVQENEFLQKCIRCRKCVEVCPYESIRVSNGFWGIDHGTPYIVPRKKPCYLCMECPPVCPTGALKHITKKEEVRMGIAVINESTCLAYNGILCRACFERCPMYREAIVLHQEVYPKVIAEKCTGCGVCENVCLTETPSIIVLKKDHNQKS